MRNTSQINLDKGSLFYLFKDPYNEERANELYEAVKQIFPLTEDPSAASAVVVIGGDGTFLKVARDPMINALPLVAINGGTVGKNLIDVTPAGIPNLYRSLVSNECVAVKLPSIKIEFEDINGSIHIEHAFNDIFVDRLFAHTVRYTASIEQRDDDTFEPVQLNDSPMSGDGILLSTSIGSTGYARVLSETILPLDDYSLLVTPMATMINESKRKVHGFILDQSKSLNVDFIDNDFRPARIAVDGVYLTKGSPLDFITVKRFSASLNENNRQMLLILPDIETFVRKQIDFIAR